MTKIDTERFIVSMIQQLKDGHPLRVNILYALLNQGLIYTGDSILRTVNKKEGPSPVVKRVTQILKESEDEKIRKALKQYFVNSFQNNGVAAICGVHVKDILAWLEKQGEQNPVVIPKFRVGDTIRPKGSLAEYTIESISGECYHGKGWGLHISCDDDYELVEQSPAWSEEDEKFFKTALWHISYSISNGKSTDFHCDTTEWLKSLKERVQPKQEWSEEEKRALNDAIVALSMCANGNIPNILPSQLLEDVEQLKSLRPQNRWKPSDEQIDCLSQHIEYERRWNSSHALNVLSELLEQLKKLK